MELCWKALDGESKSSSDPLGAIAGLHGVFRLHFFCLGSHLSRGPGDSASVISLLRIASGALLPKAAPSRVGPKETVSHIAEIAWSGNP